MNFIVNVLSPQCFRDIYHLNVKQAAGCPRINQKEVWSTHECRKIEQRAILGIDAAAEWYSIKGEEREGKGRERKGRGARGGFMPLGITTFSGLLQDDKVAKGNKEEWLEE